MILHVSIIIDLFLMKFIKRKSSIANILFGLQTGLIGIFIFHVVYKASYYTRYGYAIPCFIAIFFIATEFMFSFIE